jgi:hypothetical protein
MGEPAKARIADRGYRRYEGVRHSGGQWAVVAQQQARAQWRQRSVVLMAILAGVMTIVAGLWRYFAGLLKLDSEGYVYNLHWWTFFPALIMALRTGGGSIADDARAGGFQFYFSRPLTHAHYLAGKLLGVFLMVALVAAVPGTILAVENLVLAPDGGAVLLLLKALMLGILTSASLTCVVVALSSLIRRRGLVQAALVGVIFLPWVLGSSFRDFTRTPWPALASIPTHLGAIGQWLFHRPNEIGDRAMPVWISAIVLAAIGAAALWLALRQLRRTEVVAG